MSTITAPTRRLVLLCRYGPLRPVGAPRPFRRTWASTATRLSAAQTQTEKIPVTDKKRNENGPLRKEDAVSTVPKFRGDWVLFHPVYTTEELKSVEVLHQKPELLTDKLAHGLVKLSRTLFDFVSGYRHKEIPKDKQLSLEELRKGRYVQDDKEWMLRILFLESIAGVPGMVAATLRHLQSLRLMRRDNGWIHTCLEEAENERMHLMTFMTIRRPSILLRAMVLGAQGVFYNLFFLTYLIAPRACHRFVGYLEEEAVITYSQAIKDLEAGYLPEWANLSAPDIAVDYWRLPPNAKMVDVLYAVRSDESTHRFVNHSLANLDHYKDVNPFALREPDMLIKGKKISFSRDEAEKYVEESRSLFDQEGGKQHQ
ncbi:mitochondrial alternative oxidase [Amanita rubescens]|nr:mitochondrial alternative oxidase [Amanita rubescens]